MTHDYKAPWLHRWFARQVVWRLYGSRHCSNGPGNYTEDPRCPWCRIVARKDALGWIGLTLFAFFIWTIFLIAGGVWK